MGMGQDTLERILRLHIEKFSCSVELGTELRGFEQYPDYVEAHLAKKDENGEQIDETIRAKWLIGTDGARGIQ